MDFKDPASLLLKGGPFPGPESELLTESESESKHIQAYKYYLTTVDHTVCLYILLSSLKNTLYVSPEKHNSRKKSANIL